MSQNSSNTGGIADSDLLSMIDWKYQYIKVNLILNRLFNFQLFSIFFIYLEIKNGNQKE